MKTSVTATLGLAVAALLMASVAGAQSAAPAGGPGFGEHRPPMERTLGPLGHHGNWWNNPATVEKLKLTDVQRKAMDDILFQHRETLVDLRGNLEKAEMAMEPLMRAEQPNEAKILMQIDKVAQARAELEKANARFLLALRGKLTPEQWKQLQADRANRHDGRPGAGSRCQGPEGGNQMTPPPSPGQQGAGPQGKGDEGPGPEAPEAPEM